MVSCTGEDGGAGRCGTALRRGSGKANRYPEGGKTGGYGKAGTGPRLFNKTLGILLNTL